MARQSRTGTLISQNERLASLSKPFSQYYPYYTLSQAVRRTLEDFLKTERAHVDSMKISYRKRVKNPVDSSVFLPRLEDATVDSMLCDHFSNFLNDLIGNSRDPVSRPEEVARKFSLFYAVADNHLFGPNGKSIKGKQLKEFWLKAKKCLQLNAQSGHTYIEFMDLVSAFCGYTSFEYFLDAAFGAGYESSKDKILLDLIEKYPFSTAEKDVLSQPKSKKPRELVPNAVFEPKTEYFLGREEDLNKITEQLHKHRTLVIHGEGGMGKTTLAAAYYHRSIHTKSYKTVAWLFCEQGTLKAIYELAYGLGLNFQGVEEKERLVMIRHKLQEMGKDFLLVLDNVEDDLTDFLKNFQDFTWDVLVTSRSRMDWEEIQEFELPALSNPAAKALFKIHYRKPSGESLESGEEFELLLDKLISAIGYNTLLIEIFAKQLREEFWDIEEGRFRLREFLNRLETQGLYLEESQERVRTKYAFYRRKKDVATATDILDILYDFSKLDKNLNSLLINLALLPVGNHKVDFLVELFQPKEKGLFRSDLKELYAKGWIGGDGFNEFRISPVIQDLTIKKHQEVLWEEGKGLVERVTSLIRKEPDQDNMHTKFKWQPVAEKLAVYLIGCEESEYSALLNDLAVLLRYIGGRENLVRAVLRLENSLDSDLRNFGEDAPAVALSRSNLATVLRDLGGRENLNRAAVELEKALASYLKNFGEDVPFVATCRSNLAVVLQDLGGRENLNRAAKELEKALAWGLKNFGEEAPSVSVPRSNLAMVLMALGGCENLNRAVEELEKALASNLKNFSEDAPQVATLRSNLAMVLKALGGRENLDCAAEELENALASNLKNFSEDAPQVATVRSNLAMVLRDLGGRKNLDRAAEELENALASNQKNFSEYAPQTVIPRVNLALVLYDLQGKENLLTAKTLLVKALALSLLHFEEEHGITLAVKSSLKVVVDALKKE